MRGATQANDNECEPFSGSREEKEAIVVDLRSSLASRAARLSRSRREAAGRLRAAVEACLADLAMPESRFDVRVGWDAADLSAVSIKVDSHFWILQHRYRCILCLAAVSG